MSKRRFTDKPELNPQAVRSLPAEHPAMVENRTLFPSTVATVSASEPKNIFTSGRENRKLGEFVEKGAFKGYALLGLSLEERATCPASCAARGFCYGNGMHLARRLRIDDPEVFFDRVEAEIVEALACHRGVLVRLHVLGDFPSVGYVAFWKDMLAENPKLACYGYTHWPEASDIGVAIKAVKDEFPDRFRIRWSSSVPRPDGTTIISRVPDTRRVSEGLVCPAQTDASVCCATCGLCWEKSFSSEAIAFVKHGPKSAEAEFEAVVAPKTGSDLRSKEGGSDIRPVAPLALSGLQRAPVSTTVPGIVWRAPSELQVEGAYQRELTPRSLRLIRKIVSEFDWAKFKPPIAVSCGDGLRVIDGQHTAIAAATHGGIEKIPVFVVDGETVAERAQAFVAHNRDRINVSALEIFHAEIAAREPLAFGILKIVYECGGDIPRTLPRRDKCEPGQLVCVGELKKIVREMGQQGLRRVVTVLVKSQQAPIHRTLVRGLALALSHERFSAVAAAADERIARAVAAVAEPDASARSLSEQTGETITRAMASIIANGLEAEEARA